MDRMTGAVDAAAGRARCVDADRAARARARSSSQVYVDDKVKDYIVDVVFATREPREARAEGSRAAHRVRRLPRASIALNLAARAHAFLRHRGYVTPEDVKAVGPDVLRHRVVLTYEAEAEEVTSEQVVRRVFEVVEVP